MELTRDTRLLRSKQPAPQGSTCLCICFVPKVWSQIPILFTNASNYSIYTNDVCSISKSLNASLIPAMLIYSYINII